MRHRLNIRPAFFLLALAVAGTVVVGAGCGKKPKEQAPPPTAVEVIGVKRANIESKIDVTGTVKALGDVTLAAKVAGKVVQVPYREGDRVGQGAVVVQQDTSDLLDQIQSAKAAVGAARVRLAQAKTQSGWQDVSAQAALRQAREALNSARQQLAIVKQGPRPQERSQAASAVASAQATFDNARINLTRTRGLYQQGAVARSALDADQHSYDVAKAALDSAKQAQSLTDVGSRPEEIRVAQNTVRQSEQRLLQAQNDLKMNSVKAQDVQAAQQSLDQSKASLALAQQALIDSSIRTPISGVVALRQVEPGEMVGMGTPLIRVYNPSTIYYEATVSQVQVARLHRGQMVGIHTDAVPGKAFDGRVVRVYPSADINNRSLFVRISIQDPSWLLKPGMFARGSVVVEEHRNQIVIPQDAVVQSPSGESVFVVTRENAGNAAQQEKAGGTAAQTAAGETYVAHKRNITTGLQGDGQVEVLSGLRDGEIIVRSGQTYLRDGQEVSIVTATAGTN